MITNSGKYSVLAVLEIVHLSDATGKKRMKICLMPGSGQGRMTIQTKEMGAQTPEMMATETMIHPAEEEILRGEAREIEAQALVVTFPLHRISMVRLQILGALEA